jgi:hypothetical protein
VSDEQAVGGFWASVRDLNAAYLILALGIGLLALAIYIFRFRPASVAELAPSPDRFQSIAIMAALSLILLATAGAIWRLVSSALEDEDATIGDALASIKDLDIAYVVLAVGAIAVVAVFYLLRSIGPSGLPSMSLPSFASLRHYTLTIVVGLVALIIIVSIGRYLWVGVFGREFTSIAPFTISGSDDKQRGLALAIALQAKLAELERDSKALDDALRSETEDDAESVTPNQGDSEINSLNVYRQANFELKFQGVDVGGIFNWVFNSAATQRALQITLAEQGDKAIVSGALRPDGASYVYAGVKSDNERIVAAVAYSKFRERLIAQQPEFEGLDWEDVEQLHHSIMSVVRLRVRSQVTKDDFAKHNAAIAKLIAKAPRLEPLLVLGAEVAMKAGDAESALAYLDQAKVFLSRKRDELERARPEDANQPSSDDDTDGDKKVFKDLRRDFVTKYNNQVIQRQRIISSCALELVEQLNAHKAPPERVFMDALREHKKILRIESVDKKRDVTVAIIGGVPQRELIGYRFATTGAWYPGKYDLDNLADTVGLIVSTLSPTAKLLFVPLGQKSRGVGLSTIANEEEVEHAVGVAAAANADIVLLPFISYGSSAIRMKRAETLMKYAPGMTIVSPAFSKSVQNQLRSRGVDVLTIPAVFVASVDIDGRFKGATLNLDEEPISYPGALWAPGTRIPRLTSDAVWQTTYGTPYAAAAATAVIANVAAAVGDKRSAKELVDLIKRSRRYLQQPGSDTGVIDQVGALQADALPGAPAKVETGDSLSNICAR